MDVSVRSPERGPEAARILQLLIFLGNAAGGLVDMLGTALDPTLNDILVLAAGGVLRTVLNFFPGRELREADQRERAGQQAAGLQS
jgi:uncharacterized membrane protein